MILQVPNVLTGEQVNLHGYRIAPRDRHVSEEAERLLGIPSVPPRCEGLQQCPVGGLRDVPEVEREIDIERPDVRFPGVRQQEDRDPAPNHDHLVSEVTEQLHELDEDRFRGPHTFRGVISAGRYHRGRSFCSRMNVATSSPRPLYPTRSR